MGVLGSGRLAGAYRPDRLVGDHQAPDRLRRQGGHRRFHLGGQPVLGGPELPLFEGFADTAIGVMPFRSTAWSLDATTSSVSSNIWRRSECPTITYWTCSLASISGLTSPVKAPESAMANFWAPSATGIPSGSMTDCTVRRSVNGGCSETSTRLVSDGCSRSPRYANSVEGFEVVEVHLPVATDQWPAVRVVGHRLEGGFLRGGALTAGLSAARPGRSPYSRSSREAPPPVEMKLIWSDSPSSSTAADGVTPTHHGEGSRFSHGPGDARGPRH